MSASSDPQAPPTEDIAIFTGKGLKHWAPTDITAPGGLAGSETAAVRLAEQLTLRGRSVAVYGAVDATEHEGVRYLPLPAWDPSVHRRAVIVSREPSTVDRDIDADAVLLWMHDHSYGTEMNEERAAKFDAGLVLSDWHRGAMTELYPYLPEGFLHQIRNGIELSFFRGEHLPEVAYDPNHVIYTSSPDRGLLFLLQNWQLVRERVPEATFGFCYADTMGDLIRKYPILGGFRIKIRKLSEQEGVENLGALAQDELALKMRGTGVWVHPSWYSPTKEPWNETFCIAATEAAVAGCALVMSPWGALPERADLAEEVRYVDELDPEKWADAIAASIEAARERGPFRGELKLDPTWRAVAEEVDGIIDALVGAKTQA